MAAIIAVMEICATTSSLAAASRQFWSFSRDHGVPGWKLFSQVNSSISHTATDWVLLSPRFEKWLG